MEPNTVELLNSRRSAVIPTQEFTGLEAKVMRWGNDYLTAAAVAKKAGVSTMTVFNYYNAGLIDGLRVTCIGLKKNMDRILFEESAVSHVRELRSKTMVNALDQFLAAIKKEATRRPPSFFSYKDS